MQDLALELVALLLYGPLIVLIHEAGHAAFARWGGYRVTSFGIGLGRPLCTLPLRRGTVLYLARGLLLGGACTAIPTGSPTARRAWFHGGGLIVQGALALALLGITWGIGETWLIGRVADFNLLVALTNLLPWRLGSHASDGWYLLDTATGGRRGIGVLGQRQAFLRMADREEAVGSRIGRIHSRVCLAWADVLAGRPEAADPLFESDPADTTLEPWVDGLYLYVRAEWHRMHGRPLAALHVARQAQRLDGLPEDVQDLLTVAEARALVDVDAPMQAQRALARLAGVGGPTGAQATVILLWASLAVPVGSDAPAADDPVVELAVSRVLRRRTGSWLDPADTVGALWTAHEVLTGQDRTEMAKRAGDAARALAIRTLEAASPVDRPALEARLSPALHLPPLRLAR